MLFSAKPAAYGGSQARSQIWAAAACLCTATDMSRRVCDLLHSSQQHQILNSLSKARDQTCVLMDSSRIHFHWATRGTPYFLIFIFLGPRLCHMEVPRLGVELELQLLAYATAIAMRDPSHVYDLYCSSQQCRILNPLNGARDWTHILMDTSWVC